MAPVTTRLRSINASSPELIEAFFDSLGVRVQIYEILFAKGRFWCFFVPNDSGQDIKSVSLD